MTIVDPSTYHKYHLKTNWIVLWKSSKIIFFANFHLQCLKWSILVILSPKKKLPPPLKFLILVKFQIGKWEKMSLRKLKNPETNDWMYSVILFWKSRFWPSKMPIFDAFYQIRPPPERNPSIWGDLSFDARIQGHIGTKNGFDNLSAVKNCLHAIIMMSNY